MQDSNSIDPKQPLFVELFAGCASLSKAVAQAGFRVLSIDHQLAEQPLSPIVSLDLGTTSGQEIMWDILEDDSLLAVHMGLPCGTASRAPERPISKALQAQGVPQPPPLRSAEHPLGLPNLSDFHRAKVTAANILYSLAIEVLVFCCLHHIVVSVENPANSWLWACLVLLARRHSLQAAQMLNRLRTTCFHACCHGPTRRKHTGWMGTQGVFEPLEATCQNDHPHEPWGVRWSNGAWVFDTSSEAAYCQLLAQRVAQCLVKLATSLGRPLSTPPRLHDVSTATLGRQSKRRPPLIPEYHHVKHLPLDHPVPEGAKVLAPHLGGVNLEEVQTFGEQQKGGVLAFAETVC